MKILVLAYYISNDSSGGGSGRFMWTLAEALAEMGHEVICSTEPGDHENKRYDLIICSHFLHLIANNQSPKICISHGVENDETLYPGAQYYVSVSEEVKKHNMRNHIYSTVIPQPIKMPDSPIPGPNAELENILVIRRNENNEYPFDFLKENYSLAYSDLDRPIEDQIKWADLCITLGRGALEAMAYGRPVIVADKRDYMAAIGDGYLDETNIDEIAKCNFSGRRFKHPLTREWIEGEIAKYNPEDVQFLRQYVIDNHEATKIAGEYLRMAEGKESKVIDGLISVVIPAFNQHGMTLDCIYAVLENTAGFEIVVVDNGSEPPIDIPFTGFHECRVIRNEENKGFPAAVNQGISEAKGETIVLLNNDVTVTPGAINRLEGWLDTFDIVGPITNYAAGKQTVQVEPYQNIDELNEVAEDVAESNEDHGVEVNWVIGFCMAFKKSLADDVGAFDESLWPCSGEEIDFCLRAKEKGYSVAIAYDAYVHHEGSITFKDMEDAGQVKYAEICKRNDDHLRKKWGHDFWKQQDIDSEPSTPSGGIRLNIGCGYNHKEGYINIDNRSEVNPDLVCDVLKGLPYNNDSVDVVMAHDFLEHIPIGHTIGVIDEIWRVLKPGGVLDSYTPDAAHGQGAFQDPTHVSFWVENSWMYFSKPNYRNLYGIKANFDIEKLERTESAYNVYHLRVIARAIKGEK